MSNPIVNVAFKRGWWNSIIDALRDAGPEYTSLATNLRDAVDNAEAVELVKDAALPPITKATEIERGKQYLIQVDGGRVLPESVAQQMLDRLKQRFPTNTFAIAGGCGVVEVGKASGSTRFATGGPVSPGRPFLKEAREAIIPLHGEKGPEVTVYGSGTAVTPKADQPRARTRDELVDALRQAQDRLDTMRSKTPQELKGFYGSAMVALQQLRIALLHPERDGVAPPPAASTGAATPAADESANGARTPEATPSPLCEKLHPWLPGIYCDREPHGDKEWHYAHPVDAPNPTRTVIGWMSS